MKPGERCVSCFFRIYLLVIVSSYSKCGLAAKGGAVPFIIGGNEATRSWPWQLSLYDHGSHNCGAVLLSERYVLTAAHCVTGYASQYQVKLGAHNLNNRDWKQSIQVQYIRKHSNYSGSTDGKPNDIAILRLSQEARLIEEAVQPINITHLSESFVGAECYITGWGRTDPYVVYPPPPLQEARTEVITNEDCSVRMSGVTNGKIHDSHVCVYDSNRRVGSCTGDSGGPLSCKFPGTNDWVVAGVTSWGVSSCSTSYPSVYTRVSSFISWIYDNTGGDILLYPPLTTTYSPSDTSTTPANVSTKEVNSTASEQTRVPYEAVFLPLGAVACGTVAGAAVIRKSKKVGPPDVEKAQVDTTKTIPE